MSLLRKIGMSAGIVALGVGLLGTALAAGYPDRPITCIVPFGAGGSTDIPARVLASSLEKKLGQPIVVLNVVGGNGTQGLAQAAAATPDGYTIVYSPTGAAVLQPHFTKAPYSPDSFDAIGNAMRVPVVLMSAKSAPWKNFQEMVEIVGKEPNKYIVGITGTGNMTHIPILEMAKKYNLKFRIVPYRSASEIVKDMNAGRTHLFADPPVVLSQGELFGLVQFTDIPAEGLDIPTTYSLGYEKKIAHWQGIFAPKGIPQEAKDKLAKAMEEVCTSPEFKEEAKKIGTMADWMNPAAFKAYVDKEFADYGVIVKEVMAKD